MDKHAPEDQYNPDIAASYSLSKQLPFRLFVEQPTIFHLLGDLAGRSVLDLGCGDGIWTREIIRGGAARAVGVDLSPAMITRAKEATSGASFEVGDAATLGRLSSAPFDLVLGSYLLNYADTREKLLGMLETARANLKGGGKFVGFNDDPRDSVGAIHRVSLTERYPTYGKYGITKKWVSKDGSDERKDGDEIVYSILSAPPVAGHLEPPSFDITNYYTSPASLESAFTEAGFTGFRFVRPILDVAGSQGAGIERGFWDEMLGLGDRAGPLVGFEAIAV